MLFICIFFGKRFFIASIENTFNFLFIFFHLLLVGPSISELFGHLVAFKGSKLCLFGRLLKIFIDEPLAQFRFLILALKPLSVDALYLVIQSFFHLIIRLFSFRSLLNAPRCRLNCPERMRVPDILIFLGNRVSFIPLLDLLPPNFPVLSLHFLLVPDSPLFLLLVLRDLIMELLALANKCLNFLVEVVFHKICLSVLPSGQ